MEENPLENETEPVNLHHWNLQSYPHKWIHYYGMILLPPNQLTSNSLQKLSISSDKLPRTKIQNTFLTNKETFRFLCFFILATKTLSPPIPKKKVLYQTTIASNFWWENPKTKETKLTQACLMASVGGTDESWSTGLASPLISVLPVTLLAEQTHGVLLLLQQYLWECFEKLEMGLKIEDTDDKCRLCWKKYNSNFIISQILSFYKLKWTHTSLYLTFTMNTHHFLLTLFPIHHTPRLNLLSTSLFFVLSARLDLLEHLFVLAQSGSQASFIYKPKVGDTTDFNFLDFVDILLTYFNKLFSLQVSIQQHGCNISSQKSVAFLDYSRTFKASVDTQQIGGGTKRRRGGWKAKSLHDLEDNVAVSVGFWVFLWKLNFPSVVSQAHMFCFAHSFW